MVSLVSDEQEPREVEVLGATHAAAHPDGAVRRATDHLRLLAQTKGFTSLVTGSPALDHDYAVQSEQDLQKGDSITVPILIIILLLVTSNNFISRFLNYELIFTQEKSCIPLLKAEKYFTIEF